MVEAMNRALAILLAALALLLPAIAYAQAGARVVATTSWVEEWDPVSQQWVRVDESPADIATVRYEAAVTSVSQAGNVTITETVLVEPTRFIARPEQIWTRDAGLAQFGPFRVLDETRAALVASTDAAAPQAFAAMLAAHPGVVVIEFVDAPGTNNDLANLQLGRAIRAAGLATHVPDGGSARSGAVELFLAGTRRTMAPQALFAVHSWRDELGREPGDFAQDAPENRLYLDYYAEMGMTAEEARAFYTMTNSVPHAGALWLEGAEMARWIAPDGAGPGSPALRELAPLVDPMFEAALRLALERSGKAVAEAARMPWARPRAGLLAPRLVYADIGSMPLALLDSGVAFP
jgi:hypothetical protein